MQAKVKADYRWPAVVAFGGHEYVKSEFRPVPAGCEAEAQRHPHIETAPDPAARVELRFAGTIQDGEVETIQSAPDEVGDPLQVVQVDVMADLQDEAEAAKNAPAPAGKSKTGKAGK